MKKIALFVFNGDPMCFIHVLLNGLDMKRKGYETAMVLEGASVKLLPELDQTAHPLNRLWEKAKSEGLIAGVCKACSHKLGTIDEARKQGLALLDDMSGHPSMTGFREAGYEVITF
jgi:hypothetical protein